MVSTYVKRYVDACHDALNMKHCSGGGKKYSRPDSKTIIGEFLGACSLRKTRTIGTGVVHPARKLPRSIVLGCGFRTNFMCVDVLCFFFFFFNQIIVDCEILFFVSFFFFFNRSKNKNHKITR